MVATSTGKNVIAVDALQTNQGNNAAEASATLTVDATGTATPPTPAPAPPSAPSAKAATRATPTWGAPIQFR